MSPVLRDIFIEQREGDAILQVLLIPGFVFTLVLFSTAAAADDDDDLREREKEKEREIEREK